MSYSSLIILNIIIIKFKKKKKEDPKHNSKIIFLYISRHIRNDNIGAKQAFNDPYIPKDPQLKKIKKLLVLNIYSSMITKRKIK